MDLIRKNFDTLIKRVAERTRRFVISTSTVDRDGDSIDQRGWRLDAYKRNPVVLFAHAYDNLPIAKSLSIGVEGDKLVSIVEFPAAEIYPFADTCLRMIDAGFLNATSVGFRPVKSNRTETGIAFEEQELLEFSVVPVPCNPDALLVGRSVNERALKSWLRRGADEHVLRLDDEGGHVLHVTDDDVQLSARDVVAALREVVPVLCDEAYREAAQIIDPIADSTARHRRSGRENLSRVVRQMVAQSRGRID